MLRPDEISAEAYKERDQRFRGNLKRAGSSAMSIGGAALGSKILPFLSEYIPSELALKGISKVSPKLGSFLQKGLSQGLDLKEGLDFVKNKLSPQQAQGQKAQEHRNIVEQYSPELHHLIDQHIRSGRRPIEAAAIAQADRKHEQAIKKLSKDHKMPWSKIVESVYGSGETAQAQQPAQEHSQQQQTGQGQAALMAILQKLQQARGMQ